jgi:hypothetical protein
MYSLFLFLAMVRNKYFVSTKIKIFDLEPPAFAWADTAVIHQRDYKPQLRVGAAYRVF